jgi:general secretion pathway protein M
MNTYLLQLRERYAQLAPRERWMTALGAAAVLITLLYLLVWEPLAKAELRRYEAVQSARGLASRIEELAAEAQNRRGSAAPVNLGISVLAAVDQSAKGGLLEKAPSRVQPEGEKEVKVWIEDVSFDGLVRWLHELETRYGIRAQSAEIERQSAPGLVNARLSLVRS